MLRLCELSASKHSDATARYRDFAEAYERLKAMIELRPTGAAELQKNIQINDKRYRLRGKTIGVALFDERENAPRINSITIVYIIISKDELICIDIELR